MYGWVEEVRDEGIDGRDECMDGRKFQIRLHETDGEEEEIVEVWVKKGKVKNLLFVIFTLPPSSSSSSSTSR